MSILEQTLQLANSLLMRYCIPRIVYQISDCDSVTFLALYESITRSTVTAANRLPTRSQEHRENYDIILSHLSRFLPQDLNLDHIDPNSLSALDPLSTHNLLELMSVLGDILANNSRSHVTPSPLFAEPPIYPDLVPGLSPEMAGIPMTSYTSRYTDELALDRFQERMGALRVTEETQETLKKTTQSFIPSLEQPQTFQLHVDVSSTQSPPDRMYLLSRHTSLESIEILSISSSHFEEDMEGVDERPLSPLPPFQVHVSPPTAPQEPVPQLSITELEEWESPSPVTTPRVVILNCFRGDRGTSPLLPLNSEPLQPLLTSDSEIFPRPEPVPQLFSPPRILSNMHSPDAPLEINSILISEDSLAQETDPNRTLTPHRTPQSLSKSFGSHGLSRTEDLARMETGGYRHVKDVHREVFAPLTRGGVSHKSPYSAPVVPPRSAGKELARTPSKPLKSPGKLQRSGGRRKERVQFSHSTSLREQIRELGKEIVGEEADVSVTSVNGTILQVDEKGIEAEKRAEGRNASVRRDILRYMYRQYMDDMKQAHRERKKQKIQTQCKRKSGEELVESPEPSSKLNLTAESEVPQYEPPHSRVIRTDDDMFPMIKEEFPYMELSPAAARRLWSRQMRQIESLTKSAQPAHSRQYRDLLETEKRQIATIDILNKDLQHCRRMRDQSLKAQNDQLMKSQLREQRTAQAKSKQYYREYELRMKSRLQKKRTREEVAFQKIFEDALDIQKERVRELKHFAREQQAVQMQTQKDSLQSLENYYRDRFSMLTERISRETKEETDRRRSDNIASKRMRREVRHKLETEIQHLQDHIDDVENDTHFRELDALKFRENLRAATFLAPIK